MDENQNIENEEFQNSQQNRDAEQARVRDKEQQLDEALAKLNAQSAKLTELLERAETKQEPDKKQNSFAQAPLTKEGILVAMEKMKKYSPEKFEVKRADYERELAKLDEQNNKI